MNNNKQSNVIDLQYVIQFFKKNWILLFSCVVFSLFCAYLLNKYGSKVYSVSTSLVINEESNGFAEASAQLLNEFGFISNQKSFANEMIVLKSSPLIKSAIENLDFQISYFEKRLFNKKELYKSTPFIVILDKNYPQAINVDFNIEIIDQNTFKISANSEEVSIYSFVTNSVMQQLSSLKIDQTVKFNKYLFSDYMRFKILLNSSVDIEELKEKKYSFHINTEEYLVKSYLSKLQVLPPDLESTVAEIKLETKNPEKAIDFLNCLTTAYVNTDLNKKKFTSIQTIDYINNQLSVIGDSLKRAEQNLQFFRSQNEVTDISLQSEQFFTELRDLEKQKAVLNINTKYYEYVTSYFSKDKQVDELIAPSAMGIDDPMLNNLIEELIRLNAEKASFIENKQAKSPYLKKINIRIENLRKMISENINYYKETNNIKIHDLEARIDKLNNEIRKLPSTQRQLVGIERKYNVNDAIYTYLLQKRAEAEIAKASYQADSEIVEPASIDGLGPISPKKSLNYIIALVLGFFVPLSIIRILELTRKSFSKVGEAEAAVELPIIGKIYHHNKKCENVVDKYPKTQVAENFRHLYVGLKYFINLDKSKTILISSSIGGEGKSFVALNTAITIANSGNKTLLLAFDLRKTTLSDFLDSYSGNTRPKQIGLTEFLTSQADLDEIIMKTKNKNLDFIFSGTMAPNPGELTASEQVKVLFNNLKAKYDYIILDTSPIGLVSDAYNLIKYSDLSIFLLRLKKTPKAEFETLQQDVISKGVNSCVLLNDVTKKNVNGYGYYEERN